MYVINTCSVTLTQPDRKSRQMLHKARTLNPDADPVAERQQRGRKVSLAIHHWKQPEDHSGRVPAKRSSRQRKKKENAQEWAI